MKLNDHKVLVTGGSGGIGIAIARHFVSLGNRVAICGRDQSRLDAARAKLGDDVIAIRSDLASPDAAQKLAQDTQDALGGLSILVNNAAIQFNYSFLDDDSNTRFRDVQNEIQVNFTSVVNLTLACLPMLGHHDPAAVINISSGLAIAPKADAAVYCATKAAIHSYSRTLRYQCEDSAPNIKVFEVLPPLVDTAMTEGHVVKGAANGDGKISVEDVMAGISRGLRDDHYEINIGKVKLFRIIDRIAPGIAARIVRDS